MRNVFALGVLTFALGGCAGLSGSSSMRVEVEVYKGPLSLEPAAQWGELKGLLVQTQSAFGLAKKRFMAFADDELARSKLGREMRKNQGIGHPCDVFLRGGAYGGKGTRDLLKLCASWKEITEGAKSGIETAKRLFEDAETCDERLQAKDIAVKDARQCYRQVLDGISGFGAGLKTSGFVTAFNHVGFASDSRLVRGLQVGAANFASQLANQLEARSDALLKQMRGDESSSMPLSVYLRNASETDFLNLYVWNHAGAPSLCEEGCSQEAVENQRTRVIERLYADLNWAKINTVYASGQGDVRMIFVKDDIGNWNLKGFSNDPQELLEAYQAAGLAAVKEVATLAGSGGVAGLSKAQEALGRAKEIASGRPAIVEDGKQGKTLKVLKDRTLERLNALQAAVGERAGQLEGLIQDATGREGAAVTNVQAQTTSFNRLSSEMAARLGKVFPEGQVPSGLEEGPLQVRLTAAIITQTQTEADLARVQEQIADLEKGIVATPAPPSPATAPAASTGAVAAAAVPQPVNTDLRAELRVYQSIAKELTERRVRQEETIDQLNAAIVQVPVLRASQANLSTAQMEAEKVRAERVGLESERAGLVEETRKAAAQIINEHDRLLSEFEAVWGES